jgi:hypothetical protein
MATRSDSPRTSKLHWIDFAGRHFLPALSHWCTRAHIKWPLRLKPRAVEWTKAALINRISRNRGYRSYLEICTANTGNRYSEIDRSILRDSYRLMYWKHDGHSDLNTIDFATTGFDTTECIREIRARQLRFDIILVDAWHEYDTAVRDLGDALSLLQPRGTLVVHDCLPPSEALASPIYRAGEWCGVTYKAYLDFVIARPELEYRTVDIDFGCGVIRSRPALARSPAGDEYNALLGQWKAVGDDLGAAYRFMLEHQRPLCRVQSIEDFIRDEEG